MEPREAADLAEEKLRNVFRKLEQKSIRPHLDKGQTIAGSHGTSSDNAKDIRSSGWRGSKPDRQVGPGVYFYQSTDGVSGMQAACIWAANPSNMPSRAQQFNPCSINCEIQSCCVLDLTKDDNITYLSQLSQAMTQELFDLSAEMQHLGLDNWRLIRDSVRHLNDTRSLGKQISAYAFYRSEVDAIRVLFRVRELKKDFYGFVVPRKFEKISIVDVKTC